MDGSKSRKSEAAATRKRRSSILKSQRAPRTPFSELEFNVATPTDAKSRRVSFSRRNGVAEFEITEATTAWKNVYEQHNKSQESSVTESDCKGEERPAVPHLGSRAGLMFQDAEADLIVTCSRDFGTSFGLQDLSNDEKSLRAPRRQHDLSECTHQRTEQLFHNDANPTMKEMTDQIDLNFSAIVPIPDDLDLIEDNRSYIGTVLNETHISFTGSEVSDMSITDTIHSPKVAAVKVKPGVDDWGVSDDKENVVVNPYVAPLPAENFAAANDADDVLIFDGKKCKFESDIRSELPDVQASDHKTSDKRRTIVYNDDDADVSMTKAVPAQIIISQDLNSTTRKINATVFESNVSMTQAVPRNVIISNEQKIKQETIYFNDLADITEIVPSSVLGVRHEQRRKTIVFEAEEGHVSMTETVPANIIVSGGAGRRKTIVYQNDEGDISMTEAVPVNIIQTNNPVSDKNKTVIYDADASELEMTQAVPVNMLLTNKCEKRKTILFANDDGNMSMTQAIPAHIMSPNGSNSDKNIENIPVNLTDFEVSLQEIQGKVKEMQDCIVADVTRLCSDAISNYQNVTDASNKRKTIVFNDDQGNLSITQALPANIFVPVAPVFNESSGPIAADITEAVPAGLIMDVNNKNDESLTKDPLPDSTAAVPVVTNDIGVNNIALTEKQPTSQLNHTVASASIIEPNIPNELKCMNESVIQVASCISDKIVTISCDDLCNIPMPNPIPAQMISIENDLEDKTKEKLYVDMSEIYNETLDKSKPGPQNIIVYEATVELDKSNVPGLDAAEKGENEELVDSPSDTGAPQESKPEPMEEENSDSAESMMDIRDDRSIKSKVEEDKAIVVQASVLNDLLDMSNASMDGEQADKTETIEMATESSSNNVSIKNKESQESYLIIKDSDSDPVNVQDSESCKPVTGQPLPIEFEDHKQQTVVGELKEELGKLKTLISFRSPKQMKSPDSKPVPEHERQSNSPPSPKDTHNNRTVTEQSRTEQNKTHNANDTKALLEMLSHLTDSRISRDFTPTDPHNTHNTYTEDDTEHTHTENDIEEVAPIELKGNLAIEDKTEAGARRIMVPDRRSMVRSREDLLKDISMAQAMLENDEEVSEPEPESANETIEVKEEGSPERSVRISNEVVKTLRFDDDESLRHVESPLRKTPYEDTVPLPDGKTKVIPEYMTYVDDLKNLMSDLVKPMADADRGPTSPRKTASTCSTQIQANLLTSSQIDLVPEQDSVDSVVPAKELAPAGSPPGKSVEFSNVQSLNVRSPLRFHSPANGLIFFDQNNPLNNVLLPAVDASDVHRYSPRVSTSLLNIPEKSDTAIKSDTQNNIESRVILHNVVLPSGDASPGLMSVKHSVESTRPPSVDQSIEAAFVELKDREVNTVIAMKRNHELLNTSSSLTLVDDMMQDCDSPSPPSRSPVRVIFKGLDEVSDVDCNSADDESTTQARKRLYSPANREKKHCTFANDVTPKPASKVQKVSNRNERRKSADSPSKNKKMDDFRSTHNEDASKNAPGGRRTFSPKFKRSETAMTIHQLITKYNLDANVDKTTLAHQLLSALSSQRSEKSQSSETSEACKSLEVDSPYWGSQRDLVSESSASERSGSLARSGWQPELLNEMSSKNLVAECDSGVNVVAKIDVLPFMGTSECEWESRSADAWSVRLLRGRVRLLVRLRHRHDNAARTRVRADTQVRDAAVLPVDFDSDDPIAVLCVRFAAATMRHIVSRNCNRAGDVPALLRRCAAVSRVALRWARAMHAARTHLAYTLTRDGHVSLKVANIPLRSVWEVTLRIEQVSESDEPPTPLALDAAVSRVVSSCHVSAAELARVLAPLPRDWGHAPRALWKIFAHLKHKTLGEDILII